MYVDAPPSAVSVSRGTAHGALAVDAAAAAVVVVVAFPTEGVVEFPVEDTVDAPAHEPEQQVLSSRGSR